MKREIPMPDADGLFDLPTVRREFRGCLFANSFGNPGGAARAGSVHFDLDPAKLCRLLHLPFPNAVIAGKLAHGQSSGVPRQNALDAVETFTAQDERVHGKRWESAARFASRDKMEARLLARVLCG